MGLEYTLVRGWRLGAEKRASHERGMDGAKARGPLRFTHSWDFEQVVTIGQGRLDHILHQ